MARTASYKTLGLVSIPGAFALSFAFFMVGPPAATPAFAAGCQGANSASDGGASSAEAGQAAHRRVVDQKQAAQLEAEGVAAAKNAALIAEAGARRCG